MVPIKFLVALAAVYDGILYVLQPPTCTSASIASNDSNVTWRTMDVGLLATIPVFKLPVNNFTDSGVFTFKIKFHYPAYSAVTNWQTIVVTSKPDVLKRLREPPDNSCCVSTVVLSATLLVVLCLCVTCYFIVWSYNKLL